MSNDEESKSATSRRTFLTASGALSIGGILAGCNTAVGQMTMEETGQNASGENDAFEQNGNKWLTFGDANNWGVRYNGSTNEFEIVHKPFGENSRKNIRIEADEDGDKGDVYVDDSLIVKNETEVSDGSASDPSYTFIDQNNTGFWREGAGIVGVTTVNEPTAMFDNGTTRVAGDVTTTGDEPETVWDGSAKHTPNLPAVSARASGDGTKTRFLLTHPLNAAPEVATVTPTSRDAAGGFWVSDKTEEQIELTYASPPPEGVGNLAFDIVVSL